MLDKEVMIEVSNQTNKEIEIDEYARDEVIKKILWFR